MLAMERGERIAVFGDFDVDGVTATAILSRAFKLLGKDVLPYIPHRVEEGHGLSLQAVEAMAREKVGLMVTVDCGVTSHQEIIAAAEAGIDTIVTDHHLVPEGPPQACAVVDPRLPGSRYPFPHLTGAGLALKLTEALMRRVGADDTLWRHLLMPLAALGTVADVAPLLDENRSIVRQGLEDMRNSPLPGLMALLRSSGLESRRLDSEAIAWVLAPRLNAAGRMDHANVSYQLLTGESEEEAAVLAATLEAQNKERQRVTEEAVGLAKASLVVEPLLMVGDPSFSPGIVGLVAGRLVEEFRHPAVVVSLGEDISRGSCRSIPEFDIGGALHQVAPRIGGFERYGGHPQAAGFTVATDKLPALHAELVAMARETLGEEASPPYLDVELELPLGNLPRDVYQIVQRMAPFGSANPSPVFLSRNVQVVDMRHMGSNGSHVRLKLRDGGATWQAVAFRQGAAIPSDARFLDVVYTIEVDHWNGQDTLQLNILDTRITKS